MPVTPSRHRPDRCPALFRPWSAEDGLLVRLRLPGGRVEVRRLRELLHVAERWGDGRLHLTGRANLQLRALPGDPVSPGEVDAEVVDAVLATGPGGDLVSLVELDFPADPPSLERQAEITLMGLGKKFEVQEPVEVDGVEMYHLSGKEAKGRFADVYGAVVDGTAIRLTVRLSGEEYDAEQRTAVNQQVLDSWSWDA